MYRGFKIQNPAIEQQQYYEAIGQELFDRQKAQVQKSFRELIYSNNTLDGSAIQARWFPQVSAHVFLSHAHQDHKMALALAGRLYETFGIECFIDSCIWENAIDLLKEIDRAYCLQEDGKTYNYHIRNHSTANVHIMLSSALSMMIDRTECFFFLQTTNSVVPAEEISQTRSPWLYFELTAARLIEKRAPERYILEADRHFSDVEKRKKNLEITYDLDLGHLTPLGKEFIDGWTTRIKKDPILALDFLYQSKPPRRINPILHS